MKINILELMELEEQLIKVNITGEKFFKFGLASGTYFKNQKKTKQVAIIAKDTRLSGYTLEPALVSISFRRHACFYFRTFAN